MPRRVALLCLMALISGPPAWAEERPVAEIQVDGARVAITLERLNRYLAANQGTAPRVGLKQLIEFELLAIRADKAGARAHDSVQIARDKAMVLHYLNDFFEPLWTEQTIPNELIQRSYDNNRRIFNHPELREGVHVIVTQGGKFPEESELAAQALSIARKIEQAYRVRRPKTQAEFQRMSRSMVDWAGDSGLKVEYQSLSRFPRRGRYSLTFTDAVFAHAEEKVVLPMFKTEFGYHIVWIERVIPERKTPFEDARANILARIVPEVRSMKLLQLTDELSDKYAPIMRGKGARRLMNPAPLLSMELDVPQ